MSPRERPGAPPRGARAGLLLPAILAGLSMIGPFSTDTPFPAFPQMRAEFGVGADEMQLVVSAYLLAFGAMSLFHGPISDAVGRKPVIIGGVTAYALASLGAALSPDLTVLVICRVVQGATAGGGIIVSRTVIRDLYAGAEAQRLMSRIMMIFGLGPALAPVVSGLLLQVGPWPVIFYFQMAMGLVLVALVIPLLPETHPRAARVPLSPRGLLATLGRIARDGVFLRLAWTASLVQASWFLYIVSATLVVADLLGRGETDYWVLFLPIVIGVVAGSWLSARSAGRLGGRVVVAAGCGLALGGGVLNVALAAASATARLPYAVIGPAVMALGASIAYPTLQLALLDRFPAHRGSAASVGTCINLVFSAVLAATLAPALATSLLGLALGSLGLAVGSVLLGGIHLVLSRRPLPTPSDPDELPP